MSEEDGALEIARIVKKEEYSILISLFSNGRRDYYNLTRTYVTGNSLLLTSIAFIINALVKGDILFLAIIIMAICFLGLWLCYNFKIAQERLSTYNAYWEREIRILEKTYACASIISRSYFSRLLDFENGDIWLEAEDGPEDGESAFGRSHWIKEQTHKKDHARRMKLFPLIFGLIFGLIILFCIFFMQSNFLFTEVDDVTRVLLILEGAILGGFLGGIIIYVLRPERYIDKTLGYELAL